MTTRAPSHAGSWYLSSPKYLSEQLDGWLAAVVESNEGKEFPIPRARVIIAP